MIIDDLLKQYPFEGKEIVSEWFRRVAEATGRNRHTIERQYYLLKEKVKFNIVQRRYDGEGRLLSYVEKPQQEKIVESDLPVVRISTNLTTGQQWVIQDRSGAVKVDFTAIINEAIESLSRTPVKYKKAKNFNKKSCRNIISDVHAGMDVSEGFLNYEWNADKLNEAYNENLHDIIAQHDLFGRFERLIICDLGDNLDGYEGFTTRGGHKLEQNMTTENQFATALNASLSHIESLLAADIANQIIIERVENCNHAGSFGQVLGTSLELIISRLYPEANIKFRRLKDFISYDQYGENVDVITHGKDKKYMKSGLPYQLKPDNINYLNSIFRRWGIQDCKIRVLKGDQHRLGMEKNNFFEYYNFLSFAPPSSWQQHNFGDQSRGYSIHIMGESKRDITIINRTS